MAARVGFQFVSLVSIVRITDDDTPKDESVAIVLISADKESFFQLQEMRNKLVEVCTCTIPFTSDMTNIGVDSKCAKAEA